MRQTITDPAHVTVAGELRTAYQARTAAGRGPVAATGTERRQRRRAHPGGRCCAPTHGLPGVRALSGAEAEG